MSLRIKRNNTRRKAAWRTRRFLQRRCLAWLADVSQHSGHSGWLLPVWRNQRGSPQWAAILAITDEKAGNDLGFINTALYDIGQAQSHYSVSFFDVTSGNNSFAGIPGFSAGPGWDPTTGLGSPTADQLAHYLIQFVSPGDGAAALAGSNPSANGNPSTPGQLKPH